MEWIWRHSKAEGLTRLVLLAIGRAMHWTPNGFETGLLPMKDLVRDAKVEDSTVRKHVGILGASDGDVEVIRSKRKGEHLRIRLRRERLLPLEDIEPSPHR